MTAKIFDIVAYRESQPGSAVRVQVHADPLWFLRFWIALWKEVMKWPK